MLMKILILLTVVLCIDGQLAAEDPIIMIKDQKLTEIVVNPYLKAVSENYLAQSTAHGYVEVRPGAHLFYWLYHADGTTKDASQKPLIIWIQGGPGYAASTVGNFFEFGPLTKDFKPRNHTWVKGRNVLLFDHPVGAGFSFATEDLYATTNDDMALDLLKAIKGFYELFPMFERTPTYLIGQSYGGKICPMLAVLLNADIENKTITMNLKGIAIGGGFVEPADILLQTPGFLYQLGYIDRPAFVNATSFIKQVPILLNKSEGWEASQRALNMFEVFTREHFQNFNNIVKTSRGPELDNFSIKVESYIKPTFTEVNQSQSYSYVNWNAYDALMNEISLPASSFVETILNNTNLKVVVYTGNLDATVTLAGTSTWVHKLNWRYKEDFAQVNRHRIRGVRNGFYKEIQKLSLWFVFRAGHWVTDDNPTAMEHILDYLTAQDN